MCQEENILKSKRRTILCSIVSVILSVILALGTVIPVFAGDNNENAAGSVIPADAKKVISPNSLSKAYFWLTEDGTPMYSIDYKGITVVEESAMGFEFDFGTYKNGFELIGTNTSSVRDSWENPFGDIKTVPDCYEELTLQYQAEDGTRFDVICRAYDEGIAFRYAFPENSPTPVFTINQELTYFNLDNNATAYTHSNRNQTRVDKIAVDELNAPSAGYFRPMTIIGNGYAMTITEANQVDYCRVHFTTEEGSEPGTLRTFFNGTSDNPDLIGENRTSVVSVDTTAGTFYTSWRTFVLGDNEGQLVDQSYLIKNLNPECAFEDTSWITPGTALRASTSTEGGISAIDFAAKHNIQYVHFDASWYGPEASMDSDPWTARAEMDMDQITSYADEKGIKLVLYINYRHLESQYNAGTLDDLFAMYVNEWGIDGIKFGFVPVGSQPSTKMVYEWVKIAADNHLIVDIHDEMLPTGYERTYPNLLTLESIYGDEMNPTPKDNLGFLFTRMVNGQADHTWCFTLSRETSKSFRLAGSVVFFSPLIYPYWYDDKSLAAADADPATALWDDMITTWDDSYFAEAKIEEYATIVRQSGDIYYIAGIAAADHVLSVGLDMLTEGKKYTAEIFANDPDDIEQVVIEKYLVDSNDTLVCAMKDNYGYTVRIKPATEEEISTLHDYSSFISAADPLIEKIETLRDVTVTVENAEELKIFTEELRAEYTALSPLQKNAVSNRELLSQFEAEINRIMNYPLKAIYVNGVEFENFDRDVLEYNYVLSSGEDVPYITCEAYGESEIVELQQLSSIPGTVKITARNEFVEKTYTINYSVPENEFIYVSDFENYTLDGRKEYKKDQNRGGGTLSLYNAEGEVETFEKGVGTHANTNIYYNITGTGITRLTGVCGLSSANGNETNKIRMRIYVDSISDENLKFDSGNITQKTPYQSFDVDVKGASQVILVASDGGDGISFDHANWCDLKFMYDEPFALPLEKVVAEANELISHLGDRLRTSLNVALEQGNKVLAMPSEERTYSDIYGAAITIRNIIEDAKSELKKVSVEKTPGLVYANEEFTVTVKTSDNVKNIKLVNENGGVVASTVVSYSTLDDNMVEWTLKSKIATVGASRNINVVAYDYANEPIDTVAGFAVICEYNPETQSEIQSVDVPENVYVNETFTANVRVTSDLKNIRFTNENGKAVSAKLVSKTVGDGYTDYAYELSFGTIGNRIITVSAYKSADGTEYEKNFNINVSYNSDIEAASVNSVDLPESANAGEKFQITVVTSSNAKSVKIYNPNNGNSFGKTLVEKNGNSDGTITWVYTMSIGTPDIEPRTVAVCAANQGGVYSESMSVSIKIN